MARTWEDWPDRPFGVSEERSLSSKYCVGALCNANQVAPVGAINSNVIRIRPQCENGYTAASRVTWSMKNATSGGPDPALHLGPPPRGDWGDRAHLLDLRIRNLVADVGDNPVVIANIFFAPRHRTPIWCPKYEIFDLAFSPETEHRP